MASAAFPDGIDRSRLRESLSRVGQQIERHRLALHQRTGHPVRQQFVAGIAGLGEGDKGLVGRGMWLRPWRRAT